MKGRDKRLVNIVIPATETSEQMSFFIELSKLEIALKFAIENGEKSIDFYVGKNTVKMSIENVKQIVCPQILFIKIVRDFLG